MYAIRSYYVNTNRSIQNKIFASFLLVIIIPTIIIGISSYFISVDILKNKVSSSFSDIVKYIKYSTEKELDQIVQITDYIFADDEVKEAILESQKDSYSYQKSYNIFRSETKKYSITDTFRNSYNFV